MAAKKASAAKPAPKAASRNAGPPSSLETGVGSASGVSAGGAGDYEGRRNVDGKAGAQAYSVQIHTDEKGLEVVQVNAESGDEAAQKALEQKDYKGASVRGVTPVSDPDPNSMGGERDASIMIANAENGGGAVNPLGTEANAEAVKELGKADIKELGE
jgi:hypothetical protein